MDDVEFVPESCCYDHKDYELILLDRTDEENVLVFPRSRFFFRISPGQLDHLGSGPVLRINPSLAELYLYKLLYTYI